MLWNEAITQFYNSLEPPDLPEGIKPLLPFTDKSVQVYMHLFYTRFYHDQLDRYLLMGINPGRFGGGVTGIPFTDPIRLQEACHISNPMQKKAELSSEFMYTMMGRLGGPKAFFSNFYISSVSPVGFVSNGINLNYYDHPKLKTTIAPYVVACLEKQLQWPIQREVCFCIGEGKNHAYFSELNERHGWFKNIVALPHPRFIMQYKRRQLEDYLDDYALRLRPWMRLKARPKSM